ncbi:MAG: hypothetical protein WAN43_11085 [Rhodomicrobium sp.]
MHVPNVASAYPKELMEMARDAKQPENKQKIAARLADALERPLLLGLFGEFGAGQFALINSLLRHSACPSQFALGKRPPTLIRYAETPAMFSINKIGTKNRLTSREIAQLAQRRAAAGPAGARIIYKSRTHAAAHPQEGEDTDLPFALEFQLPLPVLAQFEICELAADEPLVERPCFSLLPTRRQPDIAAWVTLSNGAWRRSESLTWKSLSIARAKPALLVITDSESLTNDSRARLEARLKDTTQSAFLERHYLSLKDAAKILGSGKPVSHTEWLTTGIPQFEARLSALCAHVRARNLERAKRTLQALDRKPRNDNAPPLRLPA